MGRYLEDKVMRGLALGRIGSREVALGPELNARDPIARSSSIQPLHPTCLVKVGVLHLRRVQIFGKREHLQTLKRE